jgi:hypothetical protein
MLRWLVTNIDVIGGVASVGGVVLGLPALVIAMVQLRRTKRAADAAAASSREALQRLSTVVAVASIEQICSRSRDLLHLTRARNLSGSATAAFELRDALAKFCRSQAAKRLQQDETTWASLLNSVSEIHDVLEGAAAIRKIDAGRREEVLQGIARIHSQLSMLAGVAGEKAGEINAYSQ